MEFTDVAYLEDTDFSGKELNIKGHADMIWDFSKFDVEKYKDIQKTFKIEYLPKNPIVIDMKTCNDYKY